MVAIQNRDSSEKTVKKTTGIFKNKKLCQFKKAIENKFETPL